MNRRYDTFAVTILIVLWVLFFWRLFTDEASLKQGDFSAQFVAFGGYQYARFSQGEVPLWNPYNNGGMPFIADTQAAVFYPPRLITIALCNLTGTGWTYHALELEMTFHVLFYTLTMYVLIRRMTGNVFGGLVAAVVGGYSGYMSGYPPLQLALLEAGVWLPLAILGIFEATRTEKVKWFWLILTGWALGVSWMAGHPQTSFFLTYLLIAYWGFRVWRKHSLQTFLIGLALFGVISVGVVAITLFPGVEYLLRTSRSDLGYDAKGNGFPIQDLIQMIFPGVVSLWSPLYVGLTGLVLAVFGVVRRKYDAWFWFGVVIFGLALSLGANGFLYPLLYNTLPGLRFFRGQERAAFLVVHSLAILAGFGAAQLTINGNFARKVRLGLAGLATVCGLGFLMLLVLWLSNRQQYGGYIGTVAFSALIAGVLVILIPEVIKRPQVRPLLLLVLVVELFSFNMNAASNYDSIPADEQITRNPLLDIPLADAGLPFRVDGLRVLGGNFGSLYGLADIQGISPLFLGNVQEIVEYGLPDEIAWELFAVRYVFSDWDALNVPGEVLTQGEDQLGAVKLHKLTAQRPYALLMYDAVIAASDESARELLADPTFRPRDTIILDQHPGIELSGAYPEGAGATITRFEPEILTVITNTPESAVLSLAQVDYPGWYATVNGEPAEILHAYGALSAVVIPEGASTVELIFNPITYRVGAILSAITWIGLILTTIFLGITNAHQ